MKLGRKIFVTEKLVRPKVGRTREWIPVKVDRIKVMVIGIRTVFNGSVSWDSEVGNIFYYKDAVKVLLVVKNIKEKPFYIPYPKDLSVY